jgi:hypothetical protein
VELQLDMAGELARLRRGERLAAAEAARLGARVSATVTAGVTPPARRRALAVRRRRLPARA